jgi:hypothetical protein
MDLKGCEVNALNAGVSTQDRLALETQQEGQPSQPCIMRTLDGDGWDRASGRWHRPYLEHEATLSAGGTVITSRLSLSVCVLHSKTLRMRVNGSPE